MLDSWLSHIGSEKGFLPARINYPSDTSRFRMPWESMKKEEVDSWNLGEAQLEGILAKVGRPKQAKGVSIWRRYSTPAFCPTQWLTAWPCAFKLENLRWHKDWTFFDEGLTCIDGQIE